MFVRTQSEIKLVYVYNMTYDDYYFYVRFFVTREVSKLVRTVLS